MKRPHSEQAPEFTDGSAVVGHPTRASEPASGRDVHEPNDVRVRRAFEENLDVVWRMLRRLGVPSGMVDDATQHVFIVFSRRVRDVQLGRERSFLLATATRVASEVRRSLARNREVSRDQGLLELEADVRPLPDELTERRRATKLLDDVLDGMSDELREVFVLYELESLTAPEIAALFSIPLGTVASRLRRARAVFKARVAELELSRSRGEP